MVPLGEQEVPNQTEIRLRQIMQNRKTWLANNPPVKSQSVPQTSDWGVPNPNPHARIRAPQTSECASPIPVSVYSV